MSAHTPGPWHSPFSKFGEIRAENGAVIATCKKLTSLVNLQANARLIAAAPDMLSALSTIAALSRSIDDNSPLGGASDALFMAVDLAREAIAKAKGETA